MAFGLGRHGPAGTLRAVAGGLIGAILGVIAFEVVDAVGFPADRNDRLIPTSPVARLLADLFVTLGVGAGAALVALDRAKPMEATTTARDSNASQPEPAAG
jgi:hypothetical protein